MEPVARLVCSSAPILARSSHAVVSHREPQLRRQWRAQPQAPEFLDIRPFCRRGTAQKRIPCHQVCHEVVLLGSTIGSAVRSCH